MDWVILCECGIGMACISSRRQGTSADRPDNLRSCEDMQEKPLNHDLLLVNSGLPYSNVEKW